MAERTILAVDDDPSALIYLKRVLEEEGYRALTASGGEAALDVLRFETPDLLLLDIEMPGMGGYGLLKAIRGEDRTAQVPAVFLTVKDTREDEAQGLREGVVDYLSKDILMPDRVQILRYRLRNFFDWQENERLRGVLATIVAANHEINNPLTVIQGSADILRLKGYVAPHPEAGDALDRIDAACRRVKEVLQKISGMGTWEAKPYLDEIEMLDVEGSGSAAGAQGQEEG